MWGHLIAAANKVMSMGIPQSDGDQRVMNHDLAQRVWCFKWKKPKWYVLALEALEQQKRERSRADKGKAAASSSFDDDGMVNHPHNDGMDIDSTGSSSQLPGYVKMVTEGMMFTYPEDNVNDPPPFTVRHVDDWKIWLKMVPTFSLP